MAHDPGNVSEMDIYHLLDDGRIVELKLGEQLDSDGAIWARNLSDSEKATYLKLKGLGHSDMDIYNYFNQNNKKKLVCGRG